MGPPKSETSLDDRMSTALERLERLTKEDGGKGEAVAGPKTVEEAVERLKRTVADKEG